MNLESHSHMHDDSEISLTGAANALTAQTEGPSWLCLAEYGDWPHARGLQRLGRDSAERMCAYFRSLRGRLARRFGGLPVYIGHPDDPSFAGQSGHEDTRAYAWVAELEARDDGLYGLMRWSDEGRKLLSNAFYKFLSPRWAMRELGQGIYEPIRLLSVGLTNQPNIPGEAIANEVPLSDLKEIESGLRVATILEALGISDAEEPLLACNALREECEYLRAQNEQLSQENERFYRLAEDNESAREKAVSALANERRQRIELLLEQAESQGRILPGERVSRLMELEQDMDSGVKALTETRPLLKTICLSNGLGVRRSPLNHRDTFLTLVNERSVSEKTSFAHAWNLVKQERPELFAMLGKDN